MDIRVFHGILRVETCQELVSLFDRTIGAAIPSYVYNKSAEGGPRSGTVVILDAAKDHQSLTHLIHQSVLPCIEAMRQEHPGFQVLVDDGYHLTDPRIECIQPGQGFQWHMDSLQEPGDGRFMRFLIYLNDDFDDGETEFALHPVRVKPKTGSMLMFPPYWTHVHQGRSPIGRRKLTVGFFAIRKTSRSIVQLVQDTSAIERG